ncbi:MAG: hypothetical protein FWC01_05100 [Treponema sp.]|nr:hypothetical protein [Treponema sp.]MCL2237672.1 hypothetical protein [Treponema sp.]
MKKMHISALLLERYHIGEVTCEEKLYVEKAIADNDDLAASLKELERADAEFFAADKTHLQNTRLFNLHTQQEQQKRRMPRKFRPFVLGLCAAAIVMFIAVPIFILYDEPEKTGFAERAKGASLDFGAIIDKTINLSVYVKDDSEGEITRLQNQADVNEGNTIQVVYQVFDPETSEKYGVIFSIDGRSAVTMHYPYSPRQSTLLVSGRSVPLDDAFILDDAPDYEIFFFVAANVPIDTGSIINTARQLAVQIKEKPDEAFLLASSAFNEYEVDTFTLLKE